MLKHLLRLQVLLVDPSSTVNNLQRDKKLFQDSCRLFAVLYHTCRLSSIYLAREKMKQEEASSSWKSPT